MTTIHFLRHGNHGLLGNTIAGRMPGVSLDEKGRAQIERAARLLRSRRITAVYSSPLERCLETAAPVAASHGLEIRVDHQIIEVEFGGWTGRTLDELRNDEDWRRFHRFRSGSRPPGGETTLEVQNRVLQFIERMRAAHPEEEVVACSHGDVIRCALIYFLGMPIDFLGRLEVDPGSVSSIGVAEWGPSVLAVNLLPAWLEE